MTDDLADRLDAVERALTDDETAVEDLSNSVYVERRLTELEARAETFDERLAELEAAVQAVRGYVSGVRAVNRDVERRADAALATAEAVADVVDGDSSGDDPTVDGLDLPTTDEVETEDAADEYVAEHVDEDDDDRTAGDALASRLRRVL